MALDLLLDRTIVVTLLHRRGGGSFGRLYCCQADFDSIASDPRDNDRRVRRRLWRVNKQKASRIQHQAINDAHRAGGVQFHMARHSYVDGGRVLPYCHELPIWQRMRAVS
jgi:hypothetical protein